MTETFDIEAALYAVALGRVCNTDSNISRPKPKKYASYQAAHVPDCMNKIG